MVVELEVLLKAREMEGKWQNSVKLEHQCLMSCACVKKRPLVAGTAGARYRGKMNDPRPVGMEGSLDGEREKSR